MIMESRRCKIGVGIDFGTGTISVSVMKSGKLQPVVFPIDGHTLPTAAYCDETTNEWSFGSDATIHSTTGDAKNLYLHPKRHFLEGPDEPVYSHQRTPKYIVSKIMAFVREQLLKQFPELGDYPQFGGNRKPADEIALYVTVPSNWSLQQRESLIDSLRMAGFERIDGTTQESVAASRHLLHEQGDLLNSGDTILVIDVGAGTTDIVLLQYRDGNLDQVAGSAGNPYLAGADYTNAYAQEIANLCKVPWDDVFDEQTGFNLSNVKIKRRSDVVDCWQAGEELKKKLSSVKQSTVIVQTKERVAVKMERARAQEICQELHRDFKNTVSTCLDHCEFTFSDITHVLLVGGGSLAYGIRECVAEAIGRDASEILSCSDANVVSDGAAEMALFQDPVAQSLETGIGVSGIDAHSKQMKHLLLIGPKTVVPPEGLLIEQTGFNLRTQGENSVLACRPFICRQGVSATVVEGRHTLMSPQEIAELEVIHQPLPDGFTNGNHPVRTAIWIDPGGTVYLVFTPDELAGQEPIRVRLRMKQTKESKPVREGQRVIVVMDLSGSMYGEKLTEAKRSAKRFISRGIEEGSEIALIVFGGISNQVSRVISDFSDQKKPLLEAIDDFEAKEGTYIGEALMNAKSLLDSRPESQFTTTVLFSDGIPHNPPYAFEAAELLKPMSQIITVGIGDDVAEWVLKRIATCNEDYYFAAVPEDLEMVALNVAELIWTGTELVAP